MKNTASSSKPTPRFQTSIEARLLAVAALLFAGVFGVFAANSLHKIKTQYSIMQFLPPNHPALKMDQVIRDRFKLVDRPTFIGLIQLADDESGTFLEPERMATLRKLTDKTETLPNATLAVSLATVDGASEDGGNLNVGKLTQLTPPEQWKARILSDQLLTPVLITPDARSVLLIAQVEKPDVQLMVDFESNLRTVLEKYFPKSKTSVGGVPAVQTNLGLLLNKELKNFLGLTMVACAITLFMIFQTWSTMFITLFMVCFANLVVFAAMAWTGFEFTVVSSTIPIMVFISAVSMSTHTLLRVDEEAQHSSDQETRWQLLWRSWKAVFVPNLLADITTCVGFLTLLFGDVPLIRDYGKATAMSITLAWATSSLLILPLMMLFPLPSPREWVKRPAQWALGILAHKKAFVSVISIASILMAFSGSHLQWTARLFDDLPEGQEARRSTEEIDHRMGGVVPLELVIKISGEDAWMDPKAIAKLDQLVNDLRKTPGIGSARSLPDFLYASRLHEPARLKSKASIAEIFFLYSLSGYDPLQMFVSSDTHSVRIEMKLRDLPSNESEKLLGQIRNMTQQAFPEGQVELGGMGAIVHLINNELSHELIFGFWHALAIILVLLAIFWRSPRWALVSIIPNLVPPVCLLAYMAIMKIPIKPSVAIIFSIALGLAFSNTVYLLNRMRTLMKPGSTRLPVTRAFYLEGNPCLVATLIVMVGFSVFMFSYFSLNVTFGVCMLISILGGLAGDLALLPAMLKWAPWLLEPIEATPVPVATKKTKAIAPVDKTQDPRIMKHAA